MEYNEDQIKFMQAIKANWPDEMGLSVGGGEENDLGFSWCSCECCGSELGGDRFRACYYNPETKETDDLEICVDCLMYIANGDLPESWSKN